MFRVPLRLRAAAAGLALAGGCALATLLAPGPLADLRAWALDGVMVLVPRPRQADAVPIVVVDIGRLDETGTDWDRAASARLLAKIAAAGPRLVAVDVVFSGDCGDSAVNLALAEALSRGPVVLGALISRGAGPEPARPPRLAVAGSAGAMLWAAAGLEVPCAMFQGADVSLGVVSLPGEGDAMVRHVPVGVVAGGAAYPSLAVEVLRRLNGEVTPVVGPVLRGGPGLRLGARVFALEPGGMLRFVPSGPADWATRTIGAVPVLEGAAQGRLRGALVLVGSSLPQRGGLRPTARDALHPSVQIAADVIGGMTAGPLPYRPAGAAWTEATILAAMGAVVMAALARFAPLQVLGVAAGLGAAFVVTCAVIYRALGLLVDPSLPVLGLFVATFGALAFHAAVLWRAEGALRHRMGQTLPASVVSRLAEAPGLLRVKGEARDVVALFTDLEGFSELVSRATPEAVIGHLDEYFGLLSGIILRHGGMVDKIVGDGVHALFNAPLDLADPVDAALRAATEIVRASEAFREMPGRAGIGRTRIGVEWGPVVLGDVGSGARIDYTAHGAAVNLAARLQEVGRGRPEAVIIGPEAARRAKGALVTLGPVEIRSFGMVEVFALPRTEGV